MPKHHKQRGRVNRTFGSNVHPIVDEQARQNTILPLINEIKSSGEKLAALGSITTLLEDVNMRHMLLRERLIKLVLHNVLSDLSALDTVSQGIEILRRIVHFQGHDAAIFMIREHVQSPLSQLCSRALTSITTDMPSPNSADFKSLDTVCERIFGLISGIVICEGEVSGIEEIVKLGLILIKKKSDGMPFSLKSVEAAFAMIYYVSEGSDEILEKLLPEDDIASLKNVAIETTASWPAKIYGLGLEFNLLVLNTNSPDLLTNSANQLMEYIADVPKNEVSSVHVALELIAILAQTDDGGLASYLMENVGPIVLESLIPSPVHRLESIAVLNNLGWSQNALEQPWGQFAQGVYETALRHCFQDLENWEILSAALGLIGATLIQDASLVEKLGFKDLVPQLLSRVQSLYEAKNEGWAALALSLVVVLSSGDQSPAARLGFITETADLIFLLLESAASDVQVCIDSLNALFDLFGDNESPFNQAEYNDRKLNDKLITMKPSLKRSLKSPPRSNAALREQALDALNNLENFIAYKQSSS